MRFRKLLVIAGLILFLSAGWVLYKMFKSPPVGAMGEVLLPDEEVYTSQIIASGISMVNTTRRTQSDGKYRRDAHAKTHGCAAASFTVMPLEQRFRHGIFAAPKSYKAWVRFSSGSTTPQSDWKPDARGMAVKVLGVDGKKLLEGEEDDRTQDFLMIDNPVFFVQTVPEYALLTKYQGQGSEFGYFFGDGTAFMKNPARWRLRQFRIGMGILKFPPTNLLATRFYSMTAYKLWVAQNVKYSAKPVPCGQGSVPDPSVPWNKDGLRQNLSQQLKSGPAYCFDFMVQPQVAEKNMPVEDTTVEWSEKESPFVPVARIEIPKQDIAPAVDSGFCENLSFTPWHSLAEHQPLGGLNRVRKAVYQNIARYRRCKNGVAFGEPKDDGSPAFESKPCEAHEPAPVTSASR